VDFQHAALQGGSGMMGEPLSLPRVSLMAEQYHHSSAANGWWQIGNGDRAPITDVQLFFYEGRFSGSGIDQTGCFALHGKWLDGVNLSIRKHYGAIPGANLIGEYDGEGTMFGTWTSDDGQTGSWSIRMTGEIQPPNEAVLEDALRRHRLNALKYRLFNFPELD
jgi:hypothetical protein